MIIINKEEKKVQQQGKAITERLLQWIKTARDIFIRAKKKKKTFFCKKKKQKKNIKRA